MKQEVYSSLNDFKFTLKDKLDISLELVYLILTYIKVKDFTLESLIEILVPILREKFIDSFNSFIDFKDAVKSGIDLDEFIDKFCNLWKDEKETNYMNLQWDKKKMISPLLQELWMK